MNNFETDFNNIIVEVYHNLLLMEETKRKYSKASFSFRDRTPDIPEQARWWKEYQRYRKLSQDKQTFSYGTDKEAG